MTIILDKSLIIHSLFKKINPVVKILTFAIDTSKTFFILGVKKKDIYFSCVCNPLSFVSVYVRHLFWKAAECFSELLFCHFTSSLPCVAVAILAWGIDDNFTLAEELHFCYFLKVYQVRIHSELKGYQYITTIWPWSIPWRALKEVRRNR